MKNIKKIIIKIQYISAKAKAKLELNPIILILTGALIFIAMYQLDLIN